MLRSSHSHLLSAALAVTAVASTTACSDLVQEASPFPEQQALCDLRPGKPQCTDIRKFRGPSLLTFQGVCTTLKSVSSDATGYKEDATCPTADMWGGCQSESADGTLQTNWFYKSDDYKAVEDAKKECDGNTKWVAPQ